jgi:hypothetical protein
MAYSAGFRRSRTVHVNSAKAAPSSSSIGALFPLWESHSVNGVRPGTRYARQIWNEVRIAHTSSHQPSPCLTAGPFETTRSTSAERHDHAYWSALLPSPKDQDARAERESGGKSPAQMPQDGESTPTDTPVWGQCWQVVRPAS